MLKMRRAKFSGVKPLALNDRAISKDLEFTPIDNRRLMDLCGRFDEHIRLLESRLNVEILNRGNQFHIKGQAPYVELTFQLLKKLYALTQTQAELTPAKVNYMIQQCKGQTSLAPSPLLPEQPSPLETELSIQKTTVKAQGTHQSQYIQNILKHDIVFGVGPAGTGKTFLAVSCAVWALEKQSVRKIILVRPAIEAGERLGFLPGDLTQKIDPYLRPLYDNLYELLGVDQVSKLLEKKIIEIAPLAYMRGRTLNDSFIILDEGQNTTQEQMKMFLTRIGYGSKAVITGDITQIDLPKGDTSGLIHALKILTQIEHIATTTFDSKDVVRHPLVQEVIDAYERYESSHRRKR